MWRRSAVVAWQGSLTASAAAAVSAGAPPIPVAAVLLPISGLSPSPHPRHLVSVVGLLVPAGAIFSRGYMSRMRRRIPPRRPPEYDEDDEAEKKERSDPKRSIDEDGAGSHDKEEEEVKSARNVGCEEAGKGNKSF